VGGVGVADVVRAYVEALNGSDVDAVVAHVAAGFVSEHTSAIGESFTGRDEYRARLPKFFALLPERHYEIEDLLVDGDRAAVPYTLRSGAVVVRGVFLFSCRDGLIARRVDYWDSAEFLRQLDAT
jgi:ketosteroid isomerase-like protein